MKRTTTLLVALASFGATSTNAFELARRPCVKHHMLGWIWRNLEFVAMASSSKLTTTRADATSFTKLP